MIKAIKEMPGTIVGVLAGVVSLSIWAASGALPPQPPAVPEEETRLALTRSPLVGIGPKFDVDQAVLAAVPTGGAHAAAAPETTSARAAAAETTAAPSPHGIARAGASAGAETRPALLVARNAAEIAGAPPLRWYYSPPGIRRAPPEAGAGPEFAGAGGGGGPAPALDRLGVGGADAGPALVEDRFGIETLGRR